MHLIPAVFAFAVLADVTAANIPTDDICLSLYVTLWDSKPPPITYVLSSHTYTLATPDSNPVLETVTEVQKPCPSWTNLWPSPTLPLPPIFPDPPITANSPLIYQTSAPVQIPPFMPPGIVTSPPFEPPVVATHRSGDPIATTNNVVNIDPTSIPQPPLAGTSIPPSIESPPPNNPTSNPPSPPGSTAFAPDVSPSATFQPEVIPSPSPDQLSIVNSFIPSVAPISVTSLNEAILLSSTASAMLQPVVPSSTEPMPPPASSAPSEPTYNFPDCGPSQGSSPTVWNRIYFGTGVTENPINPGNPGGAPALYSDSGTITDSFSVTYACYVLQQCIVYATAHGLQSIDLHLIPTTAGNGIWECSGFAHPVGTGEYFNVQNSSILVTYGYDFYIPPSNPVSSSIQAPWDVPSSTIVANVPSSTNITPPASSTPAGLIPTDNGVCGNGVTCLGWPLGECCSEYGYCGSDSGFCGTGCQSKFGICDVLSLSATANLLSSSTIEVQIVPAPSSSSPAIASPSPTGLTPTADGVCGNGVTCLGWIPGQCCSEYGYCGADASFCGNGCQPDFGNCGLPSSSALPPAIPSSTIAAPAAVSSPAGPDCPSASALAAYDCGTTYMETGAYEFTWNELYIGSCRTEDANNPGNDISSPAITRTYGSGATANQMSASCSILQDCMNWAIAQAYDNVDIHLLQDPTPGQSHWVCVAYYDNAGGDYFNTVNTLVLLAMGYDVD